MNEMQLSLSLKTSGMRQSEMAEDRIWSSECDRAIRHLAASGIEFTAEDVRELIGDPVHHNAIGPRFHAAAHRGDIVLVGYRRAERPSRHAHPIAVWRGGESA